MSTLPFVKLARTRLKNNPALGEAWIQDRIAEDPEILGLGALSVTQRESFGNGLEQLTVTRTGSGGRYALLVQSGATDEVQLVRAIESWGKAPDTTAVLVSEEVSPRYLDLIALLGGSGQLAAIQMQAMRVGEQMTVIFTNVAGELGGGTEPELAPAAAPVVAEVPVEAGASEPTAQAAEPTAAEMPGLLLETEGTQLWNSTGLELAAPVVYPTYAAEPAICSVDRGYWERSAPGGVEMADRLLSITQAIDPAIELTYRPSYIGLARQGQPGDFARFTPEQSGLLLGLSLEPNSLIELSIAQAGLERLPNEGDGDGYQIRLAATDIEAQRAPVARLIQLAYEESRA